MRSRRDPLRGLWAGTDGNTSNQAGGSQRGRVLKETAGKEGVFWDHIKTWFKEISQKALSMTPAKTPNNSGHIAGTDHLL